MDITSIVTMFRLEILIKILLLVVIGLYIVFAIFLFFQIRSLNKILYIESKKASFTIALICFTHIILAISLFLYILAIL